MNGTGALDWRIKRLVGGPLVGVALTCDCGPLDNLAFMAALAESRPGDVLVVATRGYTGAAVTGDLLMYVARNRGVAGFVTDGLVRDLDDLETVGVPTFAMGVTPNSPQRRGPGSVGLPIVCGGVSIASGISWSAIATAWSSFRAAASRRRSTISRASRPRRPRRSSVCAMD